MTDSSNYSSPYYCNLLLGLMLKFILVAPEGDGYLICIINRKDRLLTSAVILDCLKLQEGPVAIVNLPFRLRTSTHGFFALASEIGERRELCDMSHVTPDLLQKFGADRADRG